MTVSDHELVSEARAGNPRAFDELVSRHQERVFALAYRILGNAEEAADIQQETFVRAWTRLRKFRGEALFSTWLHRITVNACLSRKRRKDWTVPTEELSEDLEYSTSASAVMRQERILNSVVVRGLLAAIPANHRVLLVLREVEERSVEEIAEIVGSSVGNVRKQLWRVRKLFRERLRECLSEDAK